MCKDDIDEKGNEKVEEFMKTFQQHGIGCGSKIAEVAKEIHPNALTIVPLYRSCIVIEQSEEEKIDGKCTIHSYADPHWLGGEINSDTLKLEDFHFEFIVRGDRQGPSILKKNCDKNENCGECVSEHYEEDDDLRILENDEN